MSRDNGQPMPGTVVAVAEHRDGRLAPLSKELAVCARKLADKWNLEVVVVVLGERAEVIAQEASRATGERVTAVQVPGLDEFHGEAYVKILAGLLPAWGAAVVVGGHTTSGMDWAPALAIDLGAACLTGVEALEDDAEGLCYRRAGLYGKVVEVMRPVSGPLIITVAPGAFKASSADAARPGLVEILEIAAPECRSRVLAVEKEVDQDSALTQAQVVVAAGRGIGKPENLELIRRLAGLFSRSAVAGSRPVCDMGWLDYRSQVGLTGATVSPRLYIACGISGARQHTVGMQGSDFIVAISNDPAAAIFNLADVCIVEDLTEFIPVLLSQS